MRPSILAVVVGSTLVFHIPDAVAGTVTWDDPATRKLNITWSSDTPDGLKATLPAGSFRIFSDTTPERVGLGGGVRLHTFNGISIEVDPESGLVEAVRKDAKGTIVRRTLFDAFAAGPSVFKKGGTTKVMVTLSVARKANAARLLSPKAPAARTQLQFDVVIYETPARGTPSVLDTVTLAYDASTLRPVVSSKVVKPYTDTYWAGTTLNYWQAGSISSWYTSPTYWLSSPTK